MLRIVGLVVAGAVALAMGASLLSSVVGVVTALRAGDIVPFIVVAITTVIFLRLSARPCESPNSLLSMSSTALTINFTTGSGVYQTPRAFLSFLSYSPRKVS